MAKKTIFINENHGKSPESSPRKLTSQDRRRVARWEKQVAYAKEHGEMHGFKAVDDGPEYEINIDPMDKVEKAIATPFPRDFEKEPDEPHEDVMHRVVNHAHQQRHGKKWS
ncbi:transcriptional regulator [Citrobacter braakii]|uniref:transcriptional regulator n=1 Tax=Citrobacter braakii TaxID=57706 RepID=UPI000CEDD295|nr:transcriptional regulator [Citrobacter braakii]PPS49137.1 transcriptional regulator [Citrobacter braakii]